MLADSGLQLLALVVVGGQECHADCVRADRRQLEVDDGAQELVGDLRDDAGAVTGARVGTDSSAVLEVAQRLESEGDDVVARCAAKGGDHGQAAGILLAGRVVQAGLRRARR